MIFNFLKLLYYYFINLHKQNNLSKIIKNNVISSNCIVIGNGPSILEDIDFVKNISKSDDTIVVNNFASSEYFETIKPKYYIVIDPDYWQDNYTIETLESRNIFNIINLKTKWSLNVIVPYVGYNKLKKHFNKNQFINLYFYNHTIISNERSSDFIEKLFLNFACTPRLQNVISASIFLSIILGYKNVFLFGVDHSWMNEIIVDVENRVCLSENHFYKSSKTRPFYKSDGTIYKLHDLLFDYSQVFKGYHYLRKFADKQNCNIINYTQNSFIDAFQRAEI